MKYIIMLLFAASASFSTFAQKANSNKTTVKSTLMTRSSYRCPMHHKVVSNEPGKCTICSMDLTLSKKEQMKKEVMKDYTCPMHDEVLSDMAGTCAKCGKTLVTVNRKGSKQAGITYVCSMHPNVVADKSGKCPICGIALIKKKG